MVSNGRRRGAALVEAVMAIPVLVVLLAALGYFGRLYSAKLGALAAVRSAAWQSALAGCDGRGAVESPLPPAISARAAAAGGADVVRAHGTARATAREPVARERVLGLLPAQVAADLELVCNERPRRGDVAGALRYGWDQVRLW
jgi:hypothetical protein